MKPIIFNTEMVKAILDGRKVCTRRPVKIKNDNPIDYIGRAKASWNPKVIGKYCFRPEHGLKNVCLNAPYQKGDILYVRETWFNDSLWGKPELYYRADGEFKDHFPNIASYRISDLKWKPSIHMPKEYARLFLKVTNVRVERLFDMTEHEAEKEGVKKFGHILALDKFKTLWNSLYNNWDSNPWVWVIDFEVINKP